MNQVKVQGRIVRVPYMGSGKSGGYAAGNIAVKDGKYDFWIGYYAPAPAANALKDAQVNEMYEFEGSLTEKKYKPQDGGKEERKIQIKVTSAKRIGGADVPKRSWDAGTELQDSDFPTW